MAEPLRATYRLQLNSEQAFSRVQEILPYLRTLGISHLYLSPIWQATPGSTHGYDVLDHAAVSEDLGGLAGFIELAVAARSHNLQIIADIVPNHVFVGGARHSWWRDVLRSGRNSAYAPYFDIDWAGRPDLPEGVLVLPVLGKPFGPALESGEIAIEHRDGELVVVYGDQTFPLRAASYGDVFGLPSADLVEVDREAFLRTLSLVQEIVRANGETTDALVASLSAAVAESPAVSGWLERRLGQLRGAPGESASFDALEAILRAQHYRLAYWRVSGEQVNYRRFFEINELAAVRMEYEPAFRETHRLVAQLCNEGYVAGLRIDHLDGLADPEAYLQRLRALCPNTRVWVEKILSAGEAPAPWPMDGTTGYEFAARVESLFHEPRGRDHIYRTYREFTGETERYDSVSFRSRRSIADRAFDGDISGIALELHRLARDSRLHSDITLRALREALVGLLAGMPQYRTYIVGEDVSESESAVIEQAARAALARDPEIVPAAMAFLTGVLEGRAAFSTDSGSISRRDIVRRVQQVAAPIMAKGVEDTAFFRFTPLISQNEVGNSPGEAPWASGKLHVWLGSRHEHWPLALNATTTHDTKRSEDARLRVAALTAIPDAWRREVRAWQRMNARWRQDGAGQPLPQTEFYLYQTLVAAWDGPDSPGFADRIWEHMFKASREAKLWTSWIEPDVEAEAELERFVRKMLDPRGGARFRARLDRFVASLRPRAEAYSLELVALKCLAPGVPDFYQGGESWLLTLTDPDNRRPPDFGGLAKKLESPDAGGDRKFWLTRSLLRLRAQAPDVFGAGAYVPIEVETPRNGTFAFMREFEGARVIVVLDAEATGEAVAEMRRSELLDGTWWDWLRAEELAPGEEELAATERLPVAVFTNFPPQPVAP